ncbi:MAG: Ig-like domain-containing protein [FCB group bacterium]|nr:Ig-like domain-containing protein [FCB group bacterium]
MRQLYTALLFVTFGMIISCNGGGNGTDPDTTPPTVVFTNPNDDQTGVPIGANITITFSENMNAATITTANITVSGGVTGTVTYGDKRATFNPSGELEFDSLYTVTVGTGVKDVAGNSLAQAYVWSFRSFSINTPPVVVATNPTNGAGDAPVTVNVTATFSKDMDPATINGTTFSINHGVTGTVSYNNKVALFTLDDYLAYDTVYTATITTGVTDTLGNAMEQNYSWQFTAEPVTITDGQEFFPMADGDTWYFTNDTGLQVTRSVQGDTTFSSVNYKKIVENGVPTEAWGFSGEGFELRMLAGLYRLDPPLTIPLDLVKNVIFYDTTHAFERGNDTAYFEITEELRFTGYVTKDVPAGHFDDVIRLSYDLGGYFEYYARGVGLLDNEDYVLDSAYIGGVWYRP